MGEISRASSERPKAVQMFSTVTEPFVESNKIPIICITGLFATHATYNPVKNSLATNTRRKVYTVDMRNFGESSFADDHSLDACSEDILYFLEQRGLEKCVLLGHSFGGKVVLQFALKWPEKVEKLVVEDMVLEMADDLVDNFSRTASVWEMIPEFVANLPSDVSIPEAYSQVSNVLRDGLLRNGFKYWDAFEGIPLRKNKDSGKIEEAGNLKAVFKTIREPDLMKLHLSNKVCSAECLFISSEQSAMPISNDNDVLKKHFPNARIEVVKSGFHHIHRELPEQYVKLVSQFINGSNV